MEKDIARLYKTIKRSKIAIFAIVLFLVLITVGFILITKEIYQQALIYQSDAAYNAASRAFNIGNKVFDKNYNTNSKQGSYYEAPDGEIGKSQVEIGKDLYPNEEISIGKDTTPVRYCQEYFQGCNQECDPDAPNSYLQCPGGASPGKPGIYCEPDLSSSKGGRCRRAGNPEDPCCAIAKPTPTKAFSAVECTQKGGICKANCQAQTNGIEQEIGKCQIGIGAGIIELSCCKIIEKDYIPETPTKCHVPLFDSQGNYKGYYGTCQKKECKVFDPATGDPTLFIANCTGGSYCCP